MPLIQFRNIAVALAALCLSSGVEAFPPIVKYWYVDGNLTKRYETPQAACESLCLNDSQQNKKNCEVPNLVLSDVGYLPCRYNWFQYTSYWRINPGFYQCPRDAIWMNWSGGLCRCNAGFTEKGNACYRPDTPLDPKNDGTPPDCGQGAFNPINSGTGNKYEGEDDYAGKSPHLLSVRRNYDSRGGNTWRIGYNWLAFPSIEVHSASMVSVRRPDHKVLVFTNQGGTWRPDADIGDRLQSFADASGTITGWRLVTSRDEIWAFAGDGTPFARRTREGQGYSISTWAYTDLGTTITDTFGRTLQLIFGDSKLRTIRDPSAGTIQYTYDTNNRLEKVTYQDGWFKRYHYEDTRFPNALTGITDENGDRYATWSYDAQGRAMTSQHAGGADAGSLTFNADGTTTVTDAYGTGRTQGFQISHGVVRLTTQSQPGGSGCNPASSAITYDANGNVASRSDFKGNKSCYAYNLSRNFETQRVEGLPASAVCATALSTPPAPTATNPVRTVTTDWHPDWRLEVKRAEPKKLTHWIYNGQPDPTAAGNTVLNCAPSTALLPDGKPIAVLCKKVEQATLDETGAQGFAASLSGTPRIWQYTYNGYGQVLSEDGPRTGTGDLTTYTYYPDTVFDETQAHTMGDLWKVTNALNQVTEYTRYDKHGHALEIKDANGVLTKMTYAPRGWLTSRQVGAELTTYDYDKVGQLKKLTLPDGSFIAYDYDAAHRLWQISDPRGNRIVYTLDTAGTRTKEEIKDPQGQLVKTLTRVPDALGRVQTLSGAE